MNVRESNGPKIDQVFFLHRISLLLDGIQSSLRIDGIPHNEGAQEQRPENVREAPWHETLLFCQAHGVCVTHGKSIPVSKQI